MNSDSRKQREQLKQEYKKHYRKMREAKEQLRRDKKTHNIATALKNMNTEELMASFDSFLFEVKSTVAHAEAKLDIALESLESKNVQSSTDTSSDITDKQKAKETISQLKNEMGLLYTEIEKQADSLHVEKTIGQSDDFVKKDSNVKER